ncbi:MAG: hypothetical protein Q4D37_08630 [Oscillospiraceae bacterium]|nr:hypothetical protein [Oscillospiraceae bacterium]
MLICENCGATNSNSASFCSKCGSEKLRIPNEKETAWDNLKGSFSSSSINYAPRSGGLFKNAGPKLKVLAIIIFVISLIIGEIIGIAAIAAGADSYYGGGMFITIGVILVIISPLLAWLSAIVVYAFGELCENVNSIRYYAAQTKEK